MFPAPCKDDAQGVRKPLLPFLTVTLWMLTGTSGKTGVNTARFAHRCRRSAVKSKRHPRREPRMTPSSSAPHRRFTPRRALAASAGVIVIGVALFVAFRPHPEKKNTHDAPVPVVLAAAAHESVPVTLAALGTVQAFNTVEVHSQVTGTIDKVLFAEGQTVKQGDVIAQIDPRPLQAALGQAEAQLSRDKATLANAQRDLARYQALAKDGFSTVQQLDAQKAAVSQSQAAIEGDQAAVNGARANLSYARITAPIDGVTGLRGIDVGNVVHPADTTPIVTITTVEPITAVFTLPAVHLPTVQEQMAKGPLTAEAFDQDNKVKLETGVLKVVDNQVDPKTGTVRMKAEFPNTAHKLWPGAFVNVRLTVDTKEGVTVPVSAVQHAAEGVFVYVIGADGKAQTRAVKLGETHGDTILVEDGVQAGENVVVDGQARLNQGSMTRVVPPHQEGDGKTGEGKMGATPEGAKPAGAPASKDETPEGGRPAKPKPSN